MGNQEDLFAEEQFKQLRTQSKYFIDAINRITYCTETAMANLLRKTFG